jgi:hypothetical protein
MRLGFPLLLLLAAPTLAAEPKMILFDKADAMRVPTGWVSAKTGEGEGSIWKVMPDRTGPGKTNFALAQTAVGPNALFNLCVLDKSQFQDGEVSVAVKAVAGEIDQGGGVVWRYQDAKNYYVCRYNPLEKNFRVYHVKDGKRTQLATKGELDVKSEVWFTVSVKHVGKAIECSLNGKKLLEVQDETFPAAGRVGVWTKADAVSHFDQFRFTPAK